MEAATVDRRLKLVLIGDSGVGKSAFLTQWYGDPFNLYRGSTIGIDSKQKQVEMAGKIISIQVWDTAGQERFKSIAPAYCRRADGVILMYSILDLVSFDSIKIWREKVDDFAPDSVRFLLLANKSDMVDSNKGRRAVPVEEGRLAATEMGAPFYEISAKTGQNVEEAMNSFVRDILVNKSEIQRTEEVVRVVPDVGTSTPTLKDKLRSYCGGSLPRASSRNNMH